MILAIGAGRLGNQLFELANVRRIKNKEEIVISVGLGEALRCVGPQKRVFNTDSRVLGRIYHVIIRRLLLLAAKFRIVAVLNVIGASRPKTIFPIIHVYGYFQSEQSIPLGFVDDFRHSAFSENGRQIVKLEAASRMPFFIHIRHGDYQEKWILPFSYYQKALAELGKTHELEKLHFFLVGDDSEWMEETFSFLPHKTISRNNKYIDLSIMANCMGGILSNSTFAWWGGFLSSGSLPVFAPKYWLSWRKKEWGSEDIECSKFVQIEV